MTSAHDSSAYDYATANQDRFLEELKQLIRIPSVSTQPEHAEDVMRAADWLAANILRVGFDSAEIIKMPEGRHPLVLGEWNGAGPDAQTVLVYSHYDVQPAAMEDGWETPPFEVVERDGKLYARGSTDSKVNVMTQIKSIESLLATGGAPVNLKLLLEGEEESGSENINAFAKQHPERLRADICVISDGGIVAPDQPSLVLGLRGIVTMELHVDGPVRDLHSGIYGGSVHNPVQALCEILSQLHDEDGRVTVPGFYNDVILPDKEGRVRLADLAPFFEADWQRNVTAPEPWGESDFLLHERVGIRPTLEINGIRGGYAGTGFKTVLPAKAMAKLSARLVPDQQPGDIFELIRSHTARLTPPTVTSELIRLDAGAPAERAEFDTPAMRAAAEAYAFAWGKPAIYEMAGGSVPISTTLDGASEQLVKMGYGYKGGQNHGPNEHIVLENFPRGIAAAIRFLELVA